MDRLEELLQEISNNEIKIVDLRTEEIIGAAVELKNKKRIIIDKTKIKNRTHERTILAHEFCHFKTGTLYKLNDCEIVKDKKEYKCNKYMVQKLVPIDTFKELLSLNYQKYEIALILEVEESIIDLAFDIYQKMNLL